MPAMSSPRITGYLMKGRDRSWRMWSAGFMAHAFGLMRIWVGVRFV